MHTSATRLQALWRGARERTDTLEHNVLSTFKDSLAGAKYVCQQAIDVARPMEKVLRTLNPNEQLLNLRKKQRFSLRDANAVLSTLTRSSDSHQRIIRHMREHNRDVPWRPPFGALYCTAGRTRHFFKDQFTALDIPALPRMAKLAFTVDERRPLSTLVRSSANSNAGKNEGRRGQGGRATPKTVTRRGKKRLMVSFSSSALVGEPGGERQEPGLLDHRFSSKDDEGDDARVFSIKHFSYLCEASRDELRSSLFARVISSYFKYLSLRWRDKEEKWQSAALRARDDSALHEIYPDLTPEDDDGQHQQHQQQKQRQEHREEQEEEEEEEEDGNEFDSISPGGGTTFGTSPMNSQGEDSPSGSRRESSGAGMAATFARFFGMRHHRDAYLSSPGASGHRSSMQRGSTGNMATARGAAGSSSMPKDRGPLTDWAASAREAAGGVAEGLVRVRKSLYPELRRNLGFQLTLERYGCLRARLRLVFKSKAWLDVKLLVCLCNCFAIAFSGTLLGTQIEFNGTTYPVEWYDALCFGFIVLLALELLVRIWAGGWQRFWHGEDEFARSVCSTPGCGRSFCDDPAIVFAADAKNKAAAHGSVSGDGGGGGIGIGAGIGGLSADSSRQVAALSSGSTGSASGRHEDDYLWWLPDVEGQYSYGFIGSCDGTFDRSKTNKSPTLCPYCAMQRVVGATYKDHREAATCYLEFRRGSTWKYWQITVKRDFTKVRSGNVNLESSKPEAPTPIPRVTHAGDTKPERILEAFEHARAKIRSKLRQGYRMCNVHEVPYNDLANRFDLAICVFALVFFTFTHGWAGTWTPSRNATTPNSANAGPLAITWLRVPIAIPVLRLFSVVTLIRSLFFGFFSVLLHFGSLFMVLIIIIYMYAALGVIFLGRVFRDFEATMPNPGDELGIGGINFDSFHAAFYSLWQLLIGEGWHSVMHAAVTSHYKDVIPLTVYFVTFTAIGTLIFTNLLIGVIIDQ